MNKFVQKFEERLYGFWDANEEETKNLLSEILQYANANPQTFISDVNEIKFDDDLYAFPII